MNRKLHVPGALTSAKRLPVLTVADTGLVSESVLTLHKSEILLPPWGIKPHTLSDRNLATMLTDLPLLSCLQHVLK
jgi:hypothetical protein